MGTTKGCPLFSHHPAVPCDRAFQNVTMLQITWVLNLRFSGKLGTDALKRLDLGADCGYKKICRVIMDKESKKKKKVGLYLDQQTYDEVKETFRKDNSRSLTEFMEKAVIHYLGYVNSNRMVNYLSPTIMSSMRAASDENVTRLSRMLFKVAVEVAIMNNLIAASLECDPSRYKELKRECEMEVRKTNGEFSMDDALRWQRKVT